jgi:hypothetical protein
MAALLPSPSLVPLKQKTKPEGPSPSFMCCNKKINKEGNSTYHCFLWCAASKKQKKKATTTLLSSPSLVRCNKNQKTKPMAMLLPLPSLVRRKQKTKKGHKEGAYFHLGSLVGPTLSSKRATPLLPPVLACTGTVRAPMALKL